MNPKILDLNAPVIFFPVRHHSPTCARLIRELASKIKPAAILIEAPFDFDNQIDELFLDHQLPIAIYSYVRLSDDTRRGAFYPFCVYSPEWQALQIAKELKIPVEFIDLPWAEIAGIALASHRYADTEFTQSSYVATLCEKLGTKDLNELWDLLFEIDPNLTLEEYLNRAHQFCFHSRISDGCFSQADLKREEFMARRIDRARSVYSGQIIVLTGGFHSYALFNRVYNLPFSESSPPPVSTIDAIEQNSNLKLPVTDIPQPTSDKGIALTPYDYQRLDALTGYDAGMSNPGFYERVWCDRLLGKTATYRNLLAEVVKDLRSKGQIFSSADLIAVETTANSLAALRNHAVVWRQDLIDSIIASVVKEALDRDRIHPCLAAVYRVLRGNTRGCLAEGTTLPPLVRDIQRRLHRYQLEPQTKPKVISLNLHESPDLERSHPRQSLYAERYLVPPRYAKRYPLGRGPLGQRRKPPQRAVSQFLHQLRLLGIAGFRQIGGTDLISRQDLSSFWEEWQIVRHPNYEASCIENAIYGTTLAEAAEARLLESASKIERDAAKAALLFLDACLMGMTHLTSGLDRQLLDLINADSDFFRVTEALGHLLYLYCYDEVLGTARDVEVGNILVTACDRSLWLLETLGTVQSKDRELLRSIKTILEAIERCQSSLNLNRTEFIAILQRVSIDDTQTPLMRGAATGVLWTLSTTPSAQIESDIIAFGAPNLLGDYLTGLFYLARELVQRHQELLLSIDRLIMTYDEETFLEALPALHLAFTYFTPREKHNIADTLTKAWGNEPPVKELQITPEVIAKAKVWEENLLEKVKRYGLRG